MKQPRNYKSESIQEFDRSAENYDQHSPFYYRMTRLCDDAVIERIASFSQEKLRILDVGCGTGALLEKLRNRFEDADLCGVDISPKMLDVARSRNIANAVFAEGDAEHLPCDDRSFDIVLCCSSFHHYPDPQKAAAEFLRVSRPGGTLMICDMNLPAIARLFANHVLFPLQKKGDVRVYARSEIQELLESQGWEKCRVEKITAFEWLALCMSPTVS